MGQSHGPNPGSHDRTPGSLKGEYAKQLKTALGPLGPVIRKSCGFFHPLQLSSHPWLLLAQLLASYEENACIMGTLQKTLGWGEVVRGQKVCINQNMRKQTSSCLEREMGRGRHCTKAENTGLASNGAHPPSCLISSGPHPETQRNLNQTVLKADTSSLASG